MQFYLVSALVFSLLVAVFAVQNTEQVTVRFITMQFPIPLVMVILGSAIVGALTLYLLGLVRQMGTWMKIRTIRHQKEELEKQVQALEAKVKGFENLPTQNSSDLPDVQENNE